MNGAEFTVVPENTEVVKTALSLGKDANAPETEKHEAVYGPLEDEYSGKRIRKSFGSRAFWGIIVATYVVGNGVFYKVSFDDGDVDILSAGEVQHDLAAAKRHADEDTSVKEPEAESMPGADATPSSPTSPSYVDALRTKKSSLKRRRDSSDADTVDDSLSFSAWQVRLWSMRLYATIMEDDGFIRVQDFVPMPDGECGEMEATGKVRPGDALMAVQGRVVHGFMDHIQACDLIRTLPRPLTLTFIRPPKSANSDNFAAVDAAIEAIVAPKKARVDDLSTPLSPSNPPSSAASTSESNQPHRTPTPPISASASDIQPPRPPSPEIEVVGVKHPPSSASPQIRGYTFAAMQDPPALSQPSSLPGNVSTFVPSGASGTEAFQPELGNNQPVHMPTATPSPAPLSAAYTGDLHPQQSSSLVPPQHQPVNQEGTQMLGSGQLATGLIPAHLASSTSLSLSSSSRQVPSQSGLIFSVPHPRPPVYRAEQATVNGFGPSSYRRYARPTVISSVYRNSQWMNQQGASMSRPSQAPPTHANVTQAMGYPYPRRTPPNVSTNTFQRMPVRHGDQNSSVDERARNMTLGDYMLHTAQQERLALRAAASQRTLDDRHPTHVPAQHTMSNLNRAGPRILPAPIAGAAVQRERSPTPEATRGKTPGNLQSVLAEVVSGDTASGGTSFLSLSEPSFLEDIPAKPRASRISGGRNTTSLSTTAPNAEVPSRPLYLSKYDGGNVVEVIVKQSRLYLTLGPMGQYISISSFVRGKSGEVGEIEASGKVLIGDILVGVGESEIPPSMSPGEVARIVSTQPRPYSAYFIRATWEMLE